MKLFLYTLIALLFAPCNASKKATASDKVTDYSKLEIVYQRTACFGRCPIYTLSIHGSSKTADFKGDQNTEKIGNYTRKVSDDELKALVDAFENAKFNDLNDEYLGMITDFPIKYITYTNNGKTKKVKERSGAPKELTDLEKTLEAFAESTGWTKDESAGN